MLLCFLQFEFGQVAYFAKEQNKKICLQITQSYVCVFLLLFLLFLLEVILLNRVLINKREEKKIELTEQATKEKKKQTKNY